MPRHMGPPRRMGPLAPKPRTPWDPHFPECLGRAPLPQGHSKCPGWCLWRGPGHQHHCGSALGTHRDWHQGRDHLPGPTHCLRRCRICTPPHHHLPAGGTQSPACPQAPGRGEAHTQASLLNVALTPARPSCEGSQVPGWQDEWICVGCAENSLQFFSRSPLMCVVAPCSSPYINNPFPQIVGTNDECSLASADRRQSAAEMRAAPQLRIRSCCIAERKTPSVAGSPSCESLRLFVRWVIM